MLDNFPTEEIKLIKKNGEIIEPVVGLVSSKSIFIEDTSIQIQEGDVFERILPNGIVEKYLVTDSGFMRGMGGHMKDHYQTKVEKITDLLPKTGHGQGYIQVTNENGNVNINSTDNSINIRISNDTTKIFNELRSAINEIDDSAELLKATDNLEDSIGKPDFLEHYNKFIQAAANHMTIIAPFLPAITSLIASN